MENRTILLVEDNPDDELLTIEALTGVNIEHSVKVFRNGIELLDYLFFPGSSEQDKTALLPALILLDLSLPMLNGIDILRKLRQHPSTRLQPVVILTSSEQEIDRKNSYANGANSFVAKPVEYSEYIYTIKQLATYWLSINLPVTD